MSHVAYLNNPDSADLYKDVYYAYIDIIKEGLEDEGSFSPDIVKLINGDLLNVDRAPLIILKRMESPQPPNIAILNEKIVEIGDKNVLETKSHVQLTLGLTSYGNTYLEAELLSNLIQKKILLTSITKIKILSKSKIVGHNLVHWGATNMADPKSKLFSNQIVIIVTVLLKGTTILK